MDSQLNYQFYDRTEMLPFVPQGVKQVLDVGCGSGKFGNMLKRERGCVVTGVEPFPAAAEAARLVLNQVIEDKVEEAVNQLPQQHFDLICFNDVLEHLVDPWVVLEACKPLLKPGGHILASVPNVLNLGNLKEVLTTRDWKYREEGILDRTHLRFFTRISTIRMFEESGYEVKQIEGINLFLTKKTKLLRMVFPTWMNDSLPLQFAVLATPKL